MIQLPGPDDCLLTGLCGANPDQVGPPPGLMFLALGLVAAGVWGLWREWRMARWEVRAKQESDERPAHGL